MSNMSITQIEKEAYAEGVSINKLCQEAEIARSTFTRLKSGDTESGNVSTIQKLNQALLKIKSSKSKSINRKPK